jgi:hypothetical protein
MKRPGFSISTILFVAVLIGGVVYVGSMVNPIKPAEHTADDGHGHGEEGKQPPGTEKMTAQKDQAPPEIGSDKAAKASSEGRQKLMESEAKMRRDMYKNMTQAAKKSANGQPDVPLKDPEAIDPTPTHFFQAEMGAEGIKKQQAEVATKKKQYEAAMAEQRKNPMGSANAPKPIPVQNVKPSAKHDHPGGEGEHDHP